mmetsp:Transcript_8494/g.16015  ORF Transcript_8494/g.16015 Transcript_8494/m.16015 type:complete len:155 (+) Transcript_8494:1147-1611(+)
MLTFSDGLTDAFRQVMKRIVNLEDEVAGLRSAGNKVVDKSVASTSGVEARDWLGNLDEEVVEDPYSPTGNEAGSGLDVCAMVASLAKRVDAIEANGGMNSKMEGEDISVFFMGVRFSSERDVDSYVRSKSNAAFNNFSTGEKFNKHIGVYTSHI